MSKTIRDATREYFELEKKREDAEHFLANKYTSEMRNLAAKYSDKYGLALRKVGMSDCPMNKAKLTRSIQSYKSAIKKHNANT